MARSITVQIGITTETYHCPLDGDRTYGPHGALVQDWATPSMPVLAAMAGIENAIDWL